MNQHLAALRRRARQWLLSERTKGTSIAAALLWHLPRRVLRKAVAATYHAFYEWTFLPLAQGRYRRSLRAALGATGATGAKEALPFVVIVVPRTLHYVVPCVVLAARHVPVVLVGNGLPRWEERQLRARFPDLPFVRLSTLPGMVLRHGLVVALLVRLAERDFALHDPDLYVFERGAYDALLPRDSELAVGAFGDVNRKTARTFPTTHLLALRVHLARATLERHRIGVDVVRRTPRHLVERLRAIGLGDHNFPKDHVAFYDILNLLWCVAASEGIAVRVLALRGDEAFHVGGVSYEAGNYYLDYVHARFLGLPICAPFAARYRTALFGDEGAERAIRRAQSVGTAEHLGAIDAGLARVTRALDTEVTT